MDENSQVVQWLWEILTDFLDSEKVLFLRFVCGRSRLPSNLSDFSQHFQVIFFFFESKTQVSYKNLRFYHPRLLSGI